jgi:hypothetical protein
MTLTELKDKAVAVWDEVWNALPVQARSGVNVIAGAAEAAAVGYVATNWAHLSLTGGWAAVYAAVGTAVGTVVTRTVNPADNYPPKP